MPKTENAEPYELPTDTEYVVAAKLQAIEGSLEIDDDAEVSRTGEPDEDGAYVQAWVWVYRTEVPGHEQED